MQIDFVESEGALDRMVAITRLMAEHPALIARHVAVYDTTSDALLAEIGRRTGNGELPTKEQLALGREDRRVSLSQA